ncbi:MAG TPA: hypothetical protein VL180_00255 [Burkholderiales bacterium]|jgi:hypothetical protein|nr:hypothetical protein [Burkholderiales bacterium]
MTGKVELTLEEELAKLEEDCRKVALAISNARTIRETVEASEIEVPHHLQAIARSKVPSLGRIAKTRDLKVEDIVREQLMTLTQEYSEIVATRDFDRIKASDWHVLRSNYPDLYAKAFREATLIIERKRKTRR